MAPARTVHMWCPSKSARRIAGLVFGCLLMLSSGISVITVIYGSAIKERFRMSPTSCEHSTCDFTSLTSLTLE